MFETETTKNKQTMKHIIKLNGKTLVCRQDEYGNYWPIENQANQQALGLGWDSENNRAAEGGLFYGSAIVGPDGNEYEAKRKSISYYTTQAGAEIELVRVELEPHEVAANVERWRDSQHRKTVREQRRAFVRAFNAVL